MTYVVNQNCIKCKLMDCVEVCPVDCFYEGENMLVIKPDECIDCGVCEPECPIDAIKPDTEEGANEWVEDRDCHLTLTAPGSLASAAEPDRDRWLCAFGDYAAAVDSL